MMRSIALVTVSLLALGAPAVAEPLADANHRFLLELLGLEEAPEGAGRLHAGGGDVTVLPVAEGLRLAAARVPLDLRAMAASAASVGGEAHAGDLSIVEAGMGACASAPPVPLPLPGSDAVPQLTVHGNGGVGVTSTWGSGMLVDMTAKSITHYPRGVTFGPYADYWCLEFFNIYLVVALVDGVALTH